MIFLISLIEMIHNNQINHLNHSSDNSNGGMPNCTTANYCCNEKSIFVIAGNSKGMATIEAKFQ